MTSKRPSEEELSACSISISRRLQKCYSAIIRSEIKKQLSDKIVNFDDSVRLLLYPISVVSAERISALMVTLPEDDRSRITMEIMSQYSNLVERIVNDNFAMLKGIGKDGH